MLAARVIRGAAAVAVAIGLVAATAPAPAAQAADPGPVDVAIIVPIVVPPNSTGLIDADSLEQYTSATGALTRQLDAVAGRPVTLAIDPMILASIRVLGTAAPASASAWLARLEAVSNESFLLPYADADVTLGLQAGSGSVLAPAGFDFAIDPARFGPAQTATPTPTPEPAAGEAPALPTAEGLLAWDSALAPLSWPVAGTVAPSDLGPIAATGVESVLLSSGNVSRDSAAGAIVEIDGTPAIVTDDAVSAALQAAAAAPGADATSAAIAAIAAAAAPQSGPAEVVATLGRSVPMVGNGIAETLSALQADPTVTLVPLSEVLSAGSSGGASLIDGGHDPERVARAAQVVQAELAEQRFATIAADPARITDSRRLALLAVLSAGWVDATAGWESATDEFLETSRDLLGAVQIVTTSPFTLLADSATLPIPVSNQLSQAVTVYVTVRPETAQLAVTESLVELTIEPNAQGRASVPVQAISNGTVQVLMTLSGASGVSVGQPAITEINVQAGWETPIVLAIAAIVVLVFAIGLVRNILRRRRPAPEGGDD